jgi:serine/threonine protein kinase
MTSRIIDGKYRLVREIGSGGMGAVYEASDLRTGRRVALKMILAQLRSENERAALRRFQREARAGGSIDSQHVAQVTDTGVDPDTDSPYLVMEFLTGEDLRQLLARARTLAPELVLRIMAQACLGLQRAHDLGIVHRDVKPANLFLARCDGGQVVVKILDFGVAKVNAGWVETGEGSELTRSGSLLGSRLYMSPEQAIGWRQLDGRSDIWSLGVVMYEALSGTTPRDGEATDESILGLCSEPARHIKDRVPCVPLEVASIVHRALSLEPSQRFQSAKEMHDALGALLPGDAFIHDRMLPLPASAANPVVSVEESARTIGGIFTTDGGTVKSRSSRAPRRRWALRSLALAASALALFSSARFSAKESKAPRAELAPSPAGEPAKAGRAESPSARLARGDGEASSASDMATPVTAEVQETPVVPARAATSRVARPAALSLDRRSSVDLPSKPTPAVVKPEVAPPPPDVSLASSLTIDREW